MKVDGWSRLTRVITTLQDTSINVIKRRKREEYQNVSNEDLQSDEEDNKEESENEDEDENKVKATEEERDKSINVDNELHNSTKDRNNTENENRTHSNEANCKNEEENKHNTFHYPSYLNKCLNYEDYLYPTDKLPNSYKEALESPEKEEWQTAMKNEIDNLINNDAFSLTTLPEDQKLIDGEWVYSYKQHPTNGRLTPTARYVAKGSTQQQYGVDYIDTHSPTIKMASLRLLMQVAAEKGLIVHHLDVKTACLNAPIDRDVYVTQPKGFEGQSLENNDSKGGNDPDDLKKQSKGNDQTKTRKQAEYSEPKQNRDKYGYYYVSRGYRVYEDKDGRRRYRRHRVYKDDEKYKRSEYENYKEDYQGNRNLYRNQNVHDDDPRRNRGHEKGSEISKEQARGKLVNRDANKNENKEKEGENEKSKEEKTPENDNRVWKLKKTMYGLKQSERNWNGHLKTVMEEKGFKKSTVDPCLYRFKASPELIAFLLFWNDDVITAASTKELLEEVKEFLKEKLKMSDLGPISWFLGIEFKQYKNFEIGMTQEQYLQGVLKKFKMEECETRSTPCDETILCYENEEKSFLEEKIPQSRYLKEIWTKYGVEECKLSSTICNAIHKKKNGEGEREDDLMNCNAIRTKKDREDEDCEKIKTRFFGRVKNRFGIHRSKYSPVNISSSNDEEEPTRYSLFNASPPNEDEANREEDNNKMNNENREDISNVNEGTPQHSEDEISLQEEKESELDENISLASKEEEKAEVVDEEKKFYKEINGEIFSIVEYDEDDENESKDDLLKEDDAFDIKNKEASKNFEQFEDETEGSGELEQERENEEKLNSEEHLEIEEQEKDDTNDENDDDNKNNKNDKNTENGDEDKEKPENDNNNENDENVGNTGNLENAENEVPSIGEKTLTEEQKNEFREILASLIYAVQATRPDLTWAVTKLSQHLACPKQPDLDIIKQILQYIKGTITYRMTFRKSKQGLKLIGYSDTEWGGGMGGRTLHRSISGYCFTVNGEDGPVISWDSILQLERALSTCEAGFLSLTTATREALFLKSLANDFDITCNEPVKVLSGNQNSISLLKGPTIKPNSKGDVTSKWKNMTQQTKGKQNNKMKWKKMTHGTILKNNDVKYDLTRDRISTKGVDVSCILPNDNIAHVMCGLQSAEQLNELHKHLFGKP